MFAWQRETHWCTRPPVCPCLRGNSRSDNRRVWRPRWWSDCWADIADIILPPGKTWRCPEGKLKRKREWGVKHIFKKKPQYTTLPPEHELNINKQCPCASCLSRLHNIWQISFQKDAVPVELLLIVWRWQSTEGDFMGIAAHYQKLICPQNHTDYLCCRSFYFCSSGMFLSINMNQIILYDMKHIQDMNY